MRAAIAVLLLLASVLSGCAGDPAAVGDFTETPGPDEAPEPTADEVPEEATPEPTTNASVADGHIELVFAAATLAVEPGQTVTFNVTPTTFHANGTRAETIADWVVSFQNATQGPVATGTGAGTFNHTFEGEGTFLFIANATAIGFGAAAANLTIIVEVAVQQPPGPGEGVEADKSCTMTAGTPIIIFTGFGITTQECTLMTTDQMTVLVSKTTAGSCTINGNVDQVYEAGKKFIAKCTGGEIQPTNTIRIRTWT